MVHIIIAAAADRKRQLAAAAAGHDAVIEAHKHVPLGYTHREHQPASELSLRHSRTWRLFLETRC